MFDETFHIWLTHLAFWFKKSFQIEAITFDTWIELERIKCSGALQFYHIAVTATPYYIVDKENLFFWYYGLCGEWITFYDFPTGKYDLREFYFNYS